MKIDGSSTLALSEFDFSKELWMLRKVALAPDLRAMYFLASKRLSFREWSTVDAPLAISYWPVFLRSTNAFAGCCGLHPYRRQQHVLELGFHLLPSYWGQGLATEAAHTVVSHAFSTLGAQSLFARHHPSNLASERVLRRLGFRYTHHERYEPTGLMHRHTSYVQAITSRWREAPNHAVLGFITRAAIPFLAR